MIVGICAHNEERNIGRLLEHLVSESNDFDVIIVSSGLVSPLFRWLCDDVTSLIKSQCIYHFNAKVLGSLYAGAVEKRGVDFYLDKAYKLGQKLAN